MSRNRFFRGVGDVAVAVVLLGIAAALGQAIVVHADDDEDEVRVIAISNPEAPPLIGVPSQFGWSVAAFKTAADELVIVGGAPFDVVGDVYAGAVHLIDGTNGDLIRTIPNPAPASGDQFGWSVAVDQSGAIIVGAPRDDDPDGAGPISEVNNTGSVFAFDTQGSQIHTIRNPFPGTGDGFGEAVAVDQFGNIIVGAMRDDDPDGAGPIPKVRDTGSVFVFDGTTANLLHTIPSVSGKAWDWFGMDVTALGGDIVVADPYHPGAGAFYGGAIRIFDGADGNLLDTWANPHPPGDGSWDQFGSRLAVDELRGEILNGAFVDDDPDGPGPIPPVINAGSVFVHNAAGAILHMIWNPFPDVGDLFGESLAAAGGKYVVGARGDDDPDGAGPIPPVFNAGSVFVFDAGTADLRQAIWNPFPGTGDLFGQSVTIVDGNVVVGASSDDDPDGPGPILPVVDAGSVFVFDAETAERKLTIESPGGLVPATVDFFGSAVAVSPSRIVAGAPSDTLDPDGPGGAEPVVRAGSVYVLKKNGKLSRTIWNPSPGVGDNFGASVAVDRHGNIVVGVPSDDDPDGDGPIPEVVDTGSVFVFDGSGTLLHTIQNPHPATGDQFGSSVAVDRYGNVVVGAPSDDDPDGPGPIAEVPNSGAVFVFDQSGSHLDTIENPAPGTPDNFGSSVAVDRHGNIIVGALNDSDPDGPGPIASVAEAGAAFVFDGMTGGLIHSLYDPGRAPVDQFGSSVAAVDGKIAVGATLSPGGSGGGAVFLFDAETGALLRTISNPASEVSDYFGSSIVAVRADDDDDDDEEEEGALLIIGAAYDDDPDGAGPIPAVVNAGAVFVHDAVTGALLRTIANPAPEIGDNFGSSVAARAGDDDDVFLVIGARGDDDPDGPDGPVAEAVNAGAVFLIRGGEDDD